MPRFLIEVPHESDTLACAKAVQIFLTTGSHFLSNADWGCMDGDHRAWIVVEVDTKDDARAVLPPAYRADAYIVKLTKFKLENIERTIRKHEQGSA